MTDKLVESDLEGLENINHNDLAEQLEAEKKTSSGTGESFEETTAELGVSKTDVPHKFDNLTKI